MMTMKRMMRKWGNSLMQRAFLCSFSRFLVTSTLHFTSYKKNEPCVDRRVRESVEIASVSLRVCGVHYLFSRGPHSELIQIFEISLEGVSH